MFALTIGAQEITAPSTLLPAAVLRAIADEVSGAEAMAHVLEMVPYERNRPGDEYGTGTYREAAYMAAKAREYGFSEVTIERFPQEHPQWDGEAAELWVEEPVRKLITRYRDVTATLVPGSTSANVTAELVYVGPGNRESHYAGTEVKGKIVLASGPVRVVHELAVRKFGAAGVASFHNAVGSPVERPDQIAWGRLTPVPADAEAQGAGPTTAFAFALSHRMGMELLDLLDKHRKVTVRAKVKATEHPVDLQVVVATITSEADAYAESVAERLRDAGLQVETDTRNEKINYKVREHSLAKVPVILVCGHREAAENTVSMRRLGSRDQQSLTLDEAVKLLGEEATPPDAKRRAAA